MAHPELSQLLGDRYTEDPFERAFYRRDLAVVPPFLASLVGNTLPDGVARPRTSDEVAAILRYAGERRLAVTPRAAGTTTFWNAVPVRGGLVLDLNGLRGLIGLDEERLTATVLPGTRWEELDHELLRRGFTLLSYPTSAPGATVGGWINMQGHGIGSLKYGGVARQVAEMEVVLADGSVVKAVAAEEDGWRRSPGTWQAPGGQPTRDTTVGDPSYVPGTSEVPGTWNAPQTGAQADAGPPVSLFAASEGTLGVITRVELKVRRRPAAIGHHLLTFRDIRALEAAVRELAAIPPRPFYAHFATPAYGEMLRRAGFLAPAKGPTLALTYDGDPEEVSAGAERVRAAARKHRATMLPDELAEGEWQERFSALRLKRAGPSLLGAECWLPLDQLAGYVTEVEALARAQGLPIATYGTVVGTALATVMSLYPCDESRPAAYLLALGVTRKLYDVAFAHAGRPYGIGVWNTPYLARAFRGSPLAERRAWKRKLDPQNVLNPGKLYAPPPFLRPPIFDLGMDTLALVRRAVWRLL